MINNTDLYLNNKQKLIKYRPVFSMLLWSVRNYFSPHSFFWFKLLKCKRIWTRFRAENVKQKIVAAINNQVICDRTNRQMKHSCYYCISHLLLSTKVKKVTPRTVQKKIKYNHRVSGKDRVSWRVVLWERTLALE